MTSIKILIEYVNATIEINSLEELFEMIEGLPDDQREIIINNDIKDKNSPYIEIYDGCRE